MRKRGGIVTVDDWPRHGAGVEQLDRLNTQTTMELCHLGFNNKTTAWGDTAFIPYYLKSSMALVNYSRGSVCLAFPFQD